MVMLWVDISLARASFDNNITTFFVILCPLLVNYSQGCGALVFV